MADSYLSLPNKRPLSSDHHHTLSPSKRSKQPPPIPAGHASLRIICHASHVGGFIGKSGSTIKQLQLDTGTKIRVDDSLRPGSDHRVIVVVGPTASDKRVEEYGAEVSAVQVAALRVFEKVLEVSKDGGGDTMVFRVLIDEGHAGYVIGKGGKIVENLRKESGAKIRVLLGDHLPPFVSPPYELVEVEGDLLAVKKALLGVCGRLQQCPQVDKSSNKETKPLESTSQPTILDFVVDPPLQRAPLYAATTSSTLAAMGRPLPFDVQRPLLYMPAVSSSPITVTRPLSFEVDRHASIESRQHQQEVVFKVLCSNDRIGGIIGKGGSIIRALQDETGARISIGPSVNDCDERLVTVTSKEDVDTSYSAAQRAVILIYTRLAEAAAEKGLDTNTVSARLLIASNQVGCLLGKGGTIVSEMRKTTGANIRILKGEQLPKCASEDDQVVEITGQFVKIQDAVYQVTSRLRSNLFASNMTSVPESQTNFSVPPDVNRYERVRNLPIGMHHSIAASERMDGLSTMRHGLDSMHNRQRLDNPPWAGSQTSEVALYASRHGEDRDLSISAHHFPATAKSIDGLSSMRHGRDSLYDHQRFDNLPLGGSRASEVALDGSRHGILKDLPIDMHHSFGTARSIDGLSSMRQGVESLYDSQRLDRSPLAGSRASEMTLNASRHGRERELPMGVHHSFMTSQSIDGRSAVRQGLDSSYDSRRLDHSPLASSRTSEVRNLHCCLKLLLFVHRYLCVLFEMFIG
ncbi:hypothetical protein RND81_11G140800 [Saponaria officinalis]|uniref:K Homology domain-containing protein n=1 Tax=Saponaria officinalis TaxID=3572 RepID=A0AAW1HM90_SAPOF